MARLEKIVFGYNGFDSNAPIPDIALRLARASGATVRLVNVVPSLPRHFAYPSPLSPGELQAAVAEVRVQQLEQLTSQLRAEGIPAEATVRTGAPHAELIREAHAVGAGLILVTEEPQGRDGPIGFGTITHKLLRKSPTPVLAVRAEPSWQPRRIAAALDVEEGSPEEQQLNHAILDGASSMARLFGCPLLLVHVWRIWGESLLESRGRMTPEELAGIKRKAEATYRERIEDLTASFDLSGLDVETRLIEGEAKHCLPATARSEGVDLMVMGTISRSGLPGLLMGNTAERVVHDLDCALLTVKPPEFSTPIQLV